MREIAAWRGGLPEIFTVFFFLLVCFLFAHVHPMCHVPVPCVVPGIIRRNETKGWGGDDYGKSSGPDRSKVPPSFSAPNAPLV